MKILHEVPRNDISYHNQNGLKCECNPEVEYVDDSVLVTHNAFDGREIIEAVEQGE